MTRPTTLPEPWAALAVALGGVQELADALGTTPSTVHRWAHGQRAPRGPALRLIGLVFDQHKVPRPWPL